MLHDLIFLPTPRQITISDASHELPATGAICLETPLQQENLLAAQQLQETVNAIPGLHWEIVGGTAIPDAQMRAVLSLTTNGTAHPQGYQLTVTNGRIHIVASTAAGLVLRRADHAPVVDAMWA
jgi:hypothetical protein